MNSELNVVSAPKTASFQMRINPEVKQKVEQLYAGYGLTMTDAVNMFLQQSLKTGGLPFLASPENEEFLRSKAAAQLKAEFEKGWSSAEKEGWVSEDDAYKMLGVDK